MEGALPPFSELVPAAPSGFARLVARDDPPIRVSVRADVVVHFPAAIDSKRLAAFLRALRS